MSAWKIVCIVILFAVLIISDIICIVHFVNKREAYRDSLLEDWSADKRAQIQLVYYYLEAPETFQEYIKALTPEDLQGFIENEVILKKVDDSIENLLSNIFIVVLVGLVLGFLVFMGIMAGF